MSIAEVFLRPAPVNNVSIITPEDKNNILFPDASKPTKDIHSDFLFKTRVRENKSTTNSAAIDYNRWQYFVPGMISPVSTIPCMDNLRGV